MAAQGGTAEPSKSYFRAEAREVIVVGGINGDCRVNVLLDLAIMTLH